MSRPRSGSVLSIGNRLSSPRRSLRIVIGPNTRIITLTVEHMTMMVTSAFSERPANASTQTNAMIGRPTRLRTWPVRTRKRMFFQKIATAGGPVGFSASVRRACFALMVAPVTPRVRSD